MDALLVVDVQNDFCPGGALGVPEGDEVVAPINALAATAPLVVATRDWHPREHGSFTERGGIWPVHCVQGTPGAELHAGLERDRLDLVIDKGQDVGTDGYSAFDATGLAALLRERGVDRLHVAGLALDYCVRASALDARAAGFEVVLHPGATRPVEVEPGDGERALDDMRAAGVTVADG